ncbi:GNAT family N-acetyltransferase [Pseudonocardia kunmingensis]|uniref:Acetyltransferase (GNAT) family protein n=1 Tax=Pseudonocardia kunmingensis TaxID=630975 RepID=A0A543DQ38_9PSEU|nr:GNAT family N-acetyltransferase [Pseudonocardia kunmingensis]TQM11451.1 acetyltransferase (GNAT) family protein [Pseudonocardia kunmingensis]
MNHQITVRRPAPTELPAVAEAYARANLNDPVLSWVIRDEDARRRFTTGSGSPMMEAYLHGISESGGLVIAADPSGTVVGISLWERNDPSRHTGEGLISNSADGTEFIDQAYGEHAHRMKLLMELTSRWRPRADAYWYLLNIVVDPDRRSQGIGGLMLRDHLQRVDDGGMPACLEASSPLNRKLYERFGFTDLGDPIRLPDGPALQPMWRHPADHGPTV